MKVLGFRMTNKEYSYVILENDFATANIVRAQTVKFPKNFSRPKTLAWLFKEIGAIVSNNSIESISIKGMEPGASKNSTSAMHRMENEAIVQLVSAHHAIDVERVVDATIAAQLGVGPKYKRRLAYEVCDEMFSNLTDDKLRDATLAAWVKMK